MLAAALQLILCVFVCTRMHACVHGCGCGGGFFILWERRGLQDRKTMRGEGGEWVRDGDKDCEREHTRDAERRGGSLLLTVSLSLPQITAISGKVRS